MQDSIESLLAVSRPTGLAGEFLHRYEKCRTMLASQTRQNAHAGLDDAPKSALPSGGGYADKRSTELDAGMPVGAVSSGDTAPIAALALRSMTLLLEAYVAARQASTADLDRLSNAAASIPTSSHR